MSMDAPENGSPPTPEEILVALVSEVRNALVPARYFLQHAPPDEHTAHTQKAILAIQRVLEFTTTCVDKFDEHLRSRLASTVLGGR